MPEPGRSIYDIKFYASQGTESARSASVVVPLVDGIIKPKSVLDVGCGTGTWLAEWGRREIYSLQGVDGDYVSRDQLRIDESQFFGHNLQEPLDLGRRFDLVTSLEVAEHLPAFSAKTFVDTLVRHGDAVLFSAAIPGQPGTDHVNCQWPSYWARLFGVHGYEPADVIRPLVWDAEDVAPYYRQNMVLFLAENVHNHLPRTSTAMLDLVHPKIYHDLALRPLRWVIEKRIRSHNIRTRMRAAISIPKRGGRFSGK